jgi:hypothetical protein
MDAKKLNVLITGSTGMVGEGVLLVCLQNPAIERIAVVNRQSLGLTDSKLTEIVHPDFYDLSTIEDQLTGFDACYFCLGMSSIGANETEYYKVTYTMTMHFWGNFKSTEPQYGFLLCSRRWYR